MKLGLLTAPFEDKDLQDVAAWAGGNGFSALEVACWPASGGEKRRYAGTSHIDVDGLSAAAGTEITAALGEQGIEISGLGYYPNPLHEDAEHRDAVAAHLMKVITAASGMGIKVVNTFIGGDRSLNVDDNWTRATRIFAPIVQHAEASGVRLCFENCPMIFSYDEWPGGHNIAYSATKIWRRIFEEWGDAVGMNFRSVASDLAIHRPDPLYQGIWAAYGACSCQGSDGRPGRSCTSNGIMSGGDGLAGAARLCGLGDVDWSNFFSGLYRAGYDGPIIIEHEDRLFRRHG